MKTSEEIDQITTALASAQGEIEALELNATNPHFKNKFANLAETRKKCRDSLSRQGIALIQSPSFEEGRVCVITRLAHKSGQWMESMLSLKPLQDNPQAIGSAITYAKRYSMQAMLGLVGDDDDDGNAATQASPQSQQSPKPETFQASNPLHLEGLRKIFPADKLALFPDVVRLMEGKAKGINTMKQAIIQAEALETSKEHAQLDKENLF